MRVWRYAFIGAAAGLGVYGRALVTIAMMVFLGEEHHFGHPLRRPPAGVSG